MITHTKTKLSIALLISAIGFIGSANGMNWTGKEKIYYLLDSDKKVTGCLSAGMKLFEPLNAMLGKEFVRITPFSGMVEQDKESLQAAFSQARNSGKIVVNKSEAWGVEQRVKIFPIKKGEGETGFVVRMSLVRLGDAPPTICSGIPLDDSE